MALYAAQLNDDTASGDLVVEDVSGGANVLYFSAAGTWDGATLALIYVQESGNQVVLDDWTFTDDFAITVPVKDGLVYQVALANAGASTMVSVELK